MNCDDRTLQLNALLDGELPATEAAELTAHLASCPQCSRLLAELGALRAALADTFPEEVISPEFHARIAGAIDGALAGGGGDNVIRFRPRAWWPQLASLTAGAALAAMLTLALLPNQHQNSELMAVRDAALRGGAVLAAAGGAAAPNVPGFQLTRARQDVVAGHPAQVLAYMHAQQTITLCIWPANGEPAHDVREAKYRGMAISYWNDGTSEYWAASAGSDAVLKSFVTEVREIRS